MFVQQLCRNGHSGGSEFHCYLFSGKRNEGLSSSGPHLQLLFHLLSSQHLVLLKMAASSLYLLAGRCLHLVHVSEDYTGTSEVSANGTLRLDEGPFILISIQLPPVASALHQSQWLDLNTRRVIVSSPLPFICLSLLQCNVHTVQA